MRDTQHSRNLGSMTEHTYLNPVLRRAQVSLHSSSGMGQQETELMPFSLSSGQRKPLEGIVRTDFQASVLSLDTGL